MLHLLRIISKNKLHSNATGQGSTMAAAGPGNDQVALEAKTNITRQFENVCGENLKLVCPKVSGEQQIFVGHIHFKISWSFTQWSSLYECVIVDVALSLSEITQHQITYMIVVWMEMIQVFGNFLGRSQLGTLQTLGIPMLVSQWCASHPWPIWLNASLIMFPKTNQVILAKPIPGYFRPRFKACSSIQNHVASPWHVGLGPGNREWMTASVFHRGSIKNSRKHSENAKLANKTW